MYLLFSYATLSRAMSIWIFETMSFNELSLIKLKKYFYT